MLGTMIDTEILVESRQADLRARVEADRLVKALPRRVGPLGFLRLAAGLGLIALGERLAGRTAGQGAPLQPAGHGLR